MLRFVLALDMILSFAGQDWDEPHVYDGATGHDILLTSREIDQLPVQNFALNLVVDFTNQTDRSYIRVDFNESRLSGRLPAQDHVFFFRHSGMRAFSMGTHDRLGTESLVRWLGGHDEVMRCIGRYADSASPTS
jgi:hypothetical protein